MLLRLSPSNNQQSNVSLGSISDPPDVNISSSCRPTLTEGDDSRLTCTASGGNPQTYTYQWRFKYNFDNSYRALSGETNSELSLRSLNYTNAGSYRCIVVNGAGGRDSKSISLNINCKFIDMVAQPFYWPRPYN